MATPLPLRLRVMSILGGFAYAMLTSLGILDVYMWWDCQAFMAIGMPGCPNEPGIGSLLTDPFLILIVIFLLTLFLGARRKENILARRAVMWWAVWLVGIFVAVGIAMLIRNYSA